ncbi:hypothetical protein [Marinicella sp. W31]|uniref:hypothetical protein n=1 Tax=Marinicella sp. W31 TaxID=3023713 RepID=UPI003756A0A4
MYRNIVIICSLLSSVVVSAETLGDLYKKSMAAYEQKDYAVFLEANQAALKLHPSQPTILYNTAAAYALTGQSDEALQGLARLISWNSTIDVIEDADFKEFRTIPEYKQLGLLRETYAKNLEASTMVQSELKGVHVEAVLPFANEVLLSDVHQGRLLRWNPQKPDQMETIIAIKESGLALYPALEPGHVWFSGAMMPQYARFEKDKENTSHLYLVDVNNKVIKKTYAIPGKSVIGAITGNAQGALYLSSSAKPVIYTLQPQAEAITAWLNLETAINLQGIDYDAKNHVLWVADYIKGIARIDVADQSVNWLHSKDYLLKGIDGLNLINDGLIAIQNNSTPKRVIKITTNKELQAKITLLDNGIFPAGEPTNGFFNKKDDTYIYVANSPWPFYSKENKAEIEQWPAVLLRQLNL